MRKVNIKHGFNTTVPKIYPMAEDKPNKRCKKLHRKLKHWEKLKTVYIVKFIFMNLKAQY